MGFIDKLRKNAPELKDRAADLARKHGDTIDSSIDKAAGAADRATKGKYSSRIDGAAGKAKDAVDKLDDGPQGGQAGRPRR